MAKTLNQFIEGYLKVKNPDEQKFVDKHVTAKHSDRNGNGDEVFKGSKVKQIDRRKERHGYNPGEDEKVYEELKGNQHKIDANKNGKVDAHDFHLLRKKKKMKEEAEQIDELSKKTLASYVKKAATSATQKGMEHGVKKAERDEMDRNMNRHMSLSDKDKVHDIMKTTHKDVEAPREKAGRRIQGINRAVSRLAKEEAEQIDELSTPTLQSYRKKARAQGNAIVDKMKMGGGDWSKDQKDTKTLRKRSSGAQMSGKQLVKRGESLKTEEVEQIEEAHYEVDVSGEHGNKGADQFVSQAKKQGMKAKVHTYNGPGGGNPVVHLSHKNKGVVHRFLKTTHGYSPKQIEDTLRIPSKLEHKYKIKEEAEDLEEKLTAKTPMGTYIKDFQKSDAPQFKGKSQEKRRAMAIAAKLTKESSMSPAAVINNKIKKAEANAKARDPHTKIDREEARVGRMLAAKARQRNEETELEEKLSAKSSMGTYIKDFQKSDAPQFKGKSQEKRRAMAIAAKLTAERGGKALRKEEKLANLLDDLAENDRRTMLSVFDKLNEDNQNKFLEACETPEGVELMLDFAISHRGE